MCWYCYWGLPEPVAQIYNKYLALFEGDASPLEFGPGHIVWSDCNFEDCSIQYCIKDCDDPRHLERFSTDLPLIRQSLIDLLAIPESVRSPAYDYDEDYEKYPPPPGVKMVKRRG